MTCPLCHQPRSVLLVPGTLDTGRPCWWVETDFPEGVPPEARCVACWDGGASLSPERNEAAGNA